MADGPFGTALQTHPMRVRIVWTAGLSQLQTGFTLRPALGEIGDAQEVATQVAGWVTSNFRNFLTTVNRIQLIDVLDIVRKEGASIAPANQYGTLNVAGDHYVPSFLAVAIALKSAKRSRLGQGRMFWPVVIEEQIDGDKMRADSLANMQGCLDALATLFTGNTVSGYNLVNAYEAKPERTRKGGKPPLPAEPAHWYDVQSMRINPIITSLKSRRAGVGS